MIGLGVVVHDSVRGLNASVWILICMSSVCADPDGDSLDRGQFYCDRVWGERTLGWRTSSFVELNAGRSRARVRAD